MYEQSAAEKELLIENQAELLEAVALNENDDKSEDDEKQQTTTTITSTTTINKLPKVDPSTLPPELRMDEYSSDDDDDDGDKNNNAMQGSAIGNLLVGNNNDVQDNAQEEQPDEQEEDIMKDSNDDSDEDLDSDDDLEDVPDTREFMPTDVEGLQAMGLSHVGAGAAMNLDDDSNNEDDDSDAEDIELSPDDAIIVVAKTEEDFASLEVHVYEPTSGNLFVHHDIPLPSFPLCLAHGDVNAFGEAGNYCAVGTFSPGIEVWNLDVLNALEPSCILGGEDTSAADELMKLNMARAASGKKLKKQLLQNKSGGLVPGSHIDAVMSLSWNKVHRQVLASGSADTTVKLWDITKANDTSKTANAATFTHHKDKVQSVVWHPTEGTLLATGSYDKTLSLVDARNTSSSNCRRVKIAADCEAIQWDPFHSQYLTVATEDGTISCWDVRKFDQSPVWSFVANEFGGVSDLSYNSKVPGMMATCAVDKTVTLWDTYSDNSSPSNAPPRPCGNKDMGVGKLFTMSFYPSSPWLLGCGGSGKELALWDLSSEAAVQKRFGSRIEGGASVLPIQEETENESSKEEDFEAMMATKDAAVEMVRNDSKTSKSKKKGKGKKKKVHKKGR